MGEAVNYIALSIPVFFLLIGVELLISRLQHTQLYRFNDAVTNLNCGIGQQVLGVFLKAFVLLLYVGVYERFRIADMPSTVLVWVLLFIGVDFFYYWFHRATHQISVLWGSHVVHHQSEEYNLTVALRQAWFQSAFSAFFYLPLAFMGFDPIMFVTVNSFQTLYQFWIHTKTINKLPRWFEYVLNTPSHHRVHHGVNPKYIDRNHGGTLIIFDRMFGTFQEEEEEVVYGVTMQPNSWNPFWLNIEYWVWLWQTFKTAPTASDRWQVLFSTPGWRPTTAETGATGNKTDKAFSVQTFHKYDTTVSPGLNYYVLLQHVATLVATTVFLFGYERFALPHRVTWAALILFILLNVGGLLERKTWAWYAEHLRLLLSMAAMLFIAGGLVNWLVLVLGYVLLSVGWLRQYKEEFGG